MAAVASTAAPGSERAEAGRAPKRQDPLAVLREFTRKEKKVRFVDDFLDFDGHKIHRHAKCAYRLSPAEPFIDIGSIWYMFREISSGDRPYTLESTKKRGFKHIGVANRGDLCDFLVGRTELEQVPGLAKEVFEGRKRPKDDLYGEHGRLSKRPKSAPMSAEPADGAPAKAEQLTYADVLERVRPVMNLDVLVRRPGRTVPSADIILRIAQEEVKQFGKRAQSAREETQVKATSRKVPLIKELEMMAEKDKNTRPIILVPCNKNAPVNLLNASMLLQDGQYAKPDDERMKYFEGCREEYVEIMRNVNGTTWTFEVRDTALNFTKDQWLRVVAVITDGTEWQFKGWPFETIVDLFTSVRGVYMLPVGELPPQHVSDWKVGVLPMSPTQFQHRFAAIRDSFWTEVEEFLQEYRVRKYVNHTTLQPDKRIVVKAKPIL